MKLSPRTPKTTLAGLLSVVLVLLSVSAAPAQILLTIDDSTPSNTIITATGTFPITSVSSNYIAYGIDLLGLFQTPVGFSNFTVNSSTLTTGDASSGPIFTQASGDNISLSNVDLNLYQNPSPLLISFTTGQAAFSGTLTLDLSGTSLPAVGSVGTIDAGYSGSSYIPIGQYEITPEPSTWLLMLGGLAALAFVRRRTLSSVRLSSK